MIEDWSLKGMPPLPIEVVSRQTLNEGSIYKEELIYIRGVHPHLGKPHNGWTGPETIVKKSFTKFEGKTIERIHKDERYGS